MSSRTLRLAVPAIIALTASTATHATAQSSSVLLRVEGLAYDSLAKQPLTGAFVSIAGVGRSATSDEKGRFRLDSVPVGTHVFSMQHAAFDSLGLSGVSVRVAVQGGMPRVTLAVPSFATLWRAACGDVPAPKDSALVFGSVRDASTNETAANANVELSWVDLVGGGKSLAQIGQRKWKRTAATDDRGEFALCGIPSNTALTLSASIDSLSTATIEIAASLARVQRREILVARRIAAASASAIDSRAGTDSTRHTTTLNIGPTGVVVGTVTSEGGNPLANAAIAIDTMAEVRSGDDGRFVLQNVPAGTRQLSVIAIGKQPFSTNLNLIAGDTARIVVPMVSVQTLEAVKVKATVASIRIRDYEERKRTSFGAFRDSTEIKNYPEFSSLLRTVPNVSNRGRGLKAVVIGGCREVDETIEWRIDGHPTTADVVATLDMQSIAATEVYTKASRVPSTLIGSKRKPCMVLVWTKLGFNK